MSVRSLGLAVLLAMVSKSIAFPSPRLRTSPDPITFSQAQARLAAEKREAGPGRYIVQFEQPAAAASSRGLVAAVRAAAAEEHQRFRQDLASIRGSAEAVQAQSAEAQESEVTREYYTVINGASVALEDDELAAVRKLPYVKRVSLDRGVEATLTYGVLLINADDVWTNLAAQGSGVTVAVIDTGIDYTHPSLGGGFGPGCKVTGGYDFVNNDSDPRDDNGHGTHVAGIVAANGAEFGVAPLANLIAYKALDAYSAPQLLLLCGQRFSAEPNHCQEWTADPTGKADIR